MKDTLLLSHAIFTGDEFSGPGLEDNIQKAIDDALPKFLDSGIDVKVIVPYSDNEAWPKEIGRKMMPKLDGYCIDIKLHGGNDFHHSSWPRDLFMQKDNLIYSPKEKTRIVVNMIDKLEPKRFILKSSKLGTGGMTVSDSGYYVSSHKLKNSAEKEGISSDFQFIKTKWHLDTRFNFISYGDDIYSVLGDEGIMSQAKMLDFDGRKHHMFIPPEKERGYLPSNFLWTGSKLYLPEGCTETAAYFKDILGSENVYGIKGSEGWLIHNGGMRCRTNIISL